MILSIPSCIASDIEAARCTSVASIKSMLDKYVLAFNVMDASCCFCYYWCLHGIALGRIIFAIFTYLTQY